MTLPELSLNSIMDKSLNAPARVLVIGKSLAPDAMESHVIEALRNLGCVALCIDTDGASPSRSSVQQRIVHRLGSILMREPERRGEKRLLNAIARFTPDLILVILGSQLSPKTITAIRKSVRAPIMCWCQDAISNLGRQYLLGGEYDAVFVKDRYMHQLFNSMVKSSTFHYLPEACNPRVHRTVELTNEDRRQYGCDVMIAGTLYYYRQEILRALSAFELRIYGNRPAWLLDKVPGSHFGRDVTLDDKARAVRAARVALNTLHCAEIDSLNCRAFEVAGCGGFQLMSAKPVLSEHFEVGAEVESFANIDELVDKVRYYLQRPDEAAAIALRGQQRAHRDHTYEQRLQAILTVAQLVRQP